VVRKASGEGPTQFHDRLKKREMATEAGRLLKGIASEQCQDVDLPPDAMSRFATE